MAKQVIDEINNNSLDIYDALKAKRLQISKLYNSLKTNKSIDLNKIKKISIKDKKYMMSKYSKKEFIFSLINLLDNKFTHLKEIKDIVNLDELVNYVITDKIFLEKVKVSYSNKILDLLLEKYYDYEDIKILSKKKEDLIEIERVINAKIIKNINEYYIRKITI